MQQFSILATKFCCPVHNVILTLGHILIYRSCRNVQLVFPGSPIFFVGLWFLKATTDLPHCRLHFMCVFFFL